MKIINMKQTWTSLIFNRNFMFAQVKLKLQLFNKEQYKTMCKILKQKYLLHNQQVQVYRDIKLLDEKNQLVGVYTPLEAKKKTEQLKKDLVLFNSTSNPVICKAIPFRANIVNKFYQDIVQENKQQILKKGKTLKVFKLSPNLTQNQLKLKCRQLLQNVKKYPRIKVTIRSPGESFEEKVQEKFKYLKSLVATNVKIIQNYDAQEGNPMLKNDKESKQQQEEQQDDQQEEQQGPKRKKRKVFSMVLQSVNNQFNKKINELLALKPQESIKKFLEAYVQPAQSDEEKRMTVKSEAEDEIQGKDKGDTQISTLHQVNENYNEQFQKACVSRLDQIQGIQRVRRLLQIVNLK